MVEQTHWHIPKGTKQQGQGGSQVLWRLMDLMATRTLPSQVWKGTKMLSKVFINTLAVTHESIVNTQMFKYHNPEEDQRIRQKEQLRTLLGNQKQTTKAEYASRSYGG